MSSGQLLRSHQAKGTCFAAELTAGVDHQQRPPELTATPICSVFESAPILSEPLREAHKRRRSPMAWAMAPLSGGGCDPGASSRRRRYRRGPPRGAWSWARQRQGAWSPWERCRGQPGEGRPGTPLRDVTNPGTARLLRQRAVRGAVVLGTAHWRHKCAALWCCSGAVAVLHVFNICPTR